MGTEDDESRRVSSYWRDIAWQSTGTSLAQLVGIAGMPVLTRLYTPEDFAVQSLFLQVVTYATALVTWRYEYFVQLLKSDVDVSALNRLVLVLGCLTAIGSTPLLWLFRHAIAAQLGNPDVATWLILAPATAVLVSWAVAIQNNAQRVGDFRTTGLSELAGKIAYVFTGIIGALTHFGAAGLMLTSAAAAIGKSTLVMALRPPRPKGSLQIEVGAVARLRNNYGPLATATVFSHLLSTSALAMPQVAIARQYGAETLGQFALVMGTIFLPSGLLGTAIGQVYYQRAAQQWAEGTPFFSLWRAMVHKLLLIGVPTYTIVALLSEFAYPLVFGDRWYLAGEFATWMSVAGLVSFVSSPMDRTCLIVGAGSYSTVWSVYRLASTVATIWLASALEFSPAGFVKAFVIQMCVALGIDLWMSRRFSQGRLGVFA